MKAIIFNSGVGKRMGELTRNCHKSMVKLANGETLFERQIRLLSECGISHFIVTTGLYENSFRQITDKYKNIKVDYVNNPLYDRTNYIYSFYLARKYIDDDFVMLHGDLVFNRNSIKNLMRTNAESCVAIDKTKALPQKDFKGKLIDNKLLEVSINIFDSNCFALQPLYKLSKRDITLWVNKVVDFIENRHLDNVYAENAMNEISSDLHICGFDVSKDFVEEIDNVEDYNRVKNAIRYFDYKEQPVYNDISCIRDILLQDCLRKPLVVVDSFLRDKIHLNLSDAIYFSDFKPNPVYEDVLKAKRLFNDNYCDCIVSIGGGSAIDTAKAVKMFLPLDEDKCYLAQEPKYINIKHIAVPTTAGTGSESTRYSVIYYNGEKQSLTNDFLIPEYCILDASFLITLPYRQKCATLFDALCHGIESLWSVNCTESSQRYSTSAIDQIINGVEFYLRGDNQYNSIMMCAANLAGKAINITQTTAAHAMSYKLTSLFGLPHGQAVALCLEALLYNFDIFDEAQHPLGSGYIKDIFSYLTKEFGVTSRQALAFKFSEMIDKFGLRYNFDYSDEQLEILINSVNPVRLNNFPVKLSNKKIENLYRFILSKR